MLEKIKDMVEQLHGEVVDVRPWGKIKAKFETSYEAMGFFFEAAEKFKNTVEMVVEKGVFVSVYFPGYFDQSEKPLLETGAVIKYSITDPISQI